MNVVGLSRSGACAECNEALRIDLADNVPDLSSAGPDDVLVHLAAKAHDRKATPEAFVRGTVQVARNVAQGLAQSSIRRVIHVSSIGARVALEEGHKARLYGRMKLEAEQAFKNWSAASRNQIVTLRPPAVFGAGAPGNIAFLRRLVRSGLPLPLGKATGRRSYLHVDDLAELILRLSALSDETFSRLDGDILEPSHACAISTRELAQAVAIAQQRNVTLLPVPRSVMEIVGKLTGRQDLVDGAFDPLVARQSDRLREVVGWQAERPVVSGVDECGD